MEHLTQLADTLVEHDSVIATAVSDDGVIVQIAGSKIGPDLLCEIGIAGAALEPLRVDADTIVVRLEPWA